MGDNSVSRVSPGVLAACGHPGTMKRGGGGGRFWGALRQWRRCARNWAWVILRGRVVEPLGRESRRVPSGHWSGGRSLRIRGGGARAPRARVGGRGVPGAPGVSPRLFFAADAGFALFALALSVVSRRVVSVQGYPISKPWAASFQLSSSPGGEAELQNAMIKWTLSLSAPQIVQATSRKEALNEL